jgi:single-strand DNA-binding protein
MASYNKVLLIGNLTRDPQLSYLPSQTPVVEFGLAVNRRWKGKSGEDRDETCFVDCRAFGRLAENINKYMSKGRPLFVEGRLTYETWTAQDGSKRSRHRVMVENCQFLGTPGGPGGPSGQPVGESASGAGEGAPEGDSLTGGAAEPKSNDDIPF